MKPRIIVTLVVAIVSFSVALPAVRHVLRTTGNHTWANAHLDLRRLQQRLDHYRTDHGELPAAERINELMAEEWAGNTEFYDGAESDQDIQLSYVIRSARAERIHLWDRPPIFKMTPDSEMGFGFYLEGDDGTSLSAGNDPDDINSWDFDSVAYYYDRLNRRKEAINVGVALVLALPLVLIAYAVSGRFTGGSNKAQQGGAGQPRRA
jgi:hypothetical protein